MATVSSGRRRAPPRGARCARDHRVHVPARQVGRRRPPVSGDLLQNVVKSSQAATTRRRSRPVVTASSPVTVMRTLGVPGVRGWGASRAPDTSGGSMVEAARPHVGGGGPPSFTYSLVVPVLQQRRPGRHHDRPDRRGLRGRRPELPAGAGQRRQPGRQLGGHRRGGAGQPAPGGAQPAPELRPAPRQRRGVPRGERGLRDHPGRRPPEPARGGARAHRRGNARLGRRVRPVRPQAGGRLPTGRQPPDQHDQPPGLRAAARAHRVQLPDPPPVGELHLGRTAHPTSPVRRRHRAPTSGAPRPRPSGTSGYSSADPAARVRHPPPSVLSSFPLPRPPLGASWWPD